MNFWIKKPPRLPRLKTKIFLETDWITNFWIIGDSIYFTDADLLKSRSLLAKMPLAELKALALSNTGEENARFFANPHPIYSSPEKITTTAMILERVDEGYLYTLNLINQQLHRSLIRPGDRGGTYVNDMLVQQNIALLGSVNEEIYGKSIIDKRTIILVNPKNPIYEIAKLSIKKIIHVDQKDVILTTENEIYYCNDVVYSSANDLEIASFGNDAILVSERHTQDLFVLYGKNFLNKKTIWHGNYFYHLIAVDKNLIIGKPFFDNNKKVNFSQPLTFIT